MSDHNSGITNVGAGQANPAEGQASSKGKGKAVDLRSQDMSMDEEDDSSDEEDGADDVRFSLVLAFLPLLVADCQLCIRPMESRVTNCLQL